ncbi:hypothetical protein HanPSC8_Chr12g0505961 [Helianthus annuus]|nr:hypothetical protein HanPSC8_Chr12g0505961 [Helianthus annuus]
MNYQTQTNINEHVTERSQTNINERPRPLVMFVHLTSQTFNFTNELPAERLTSCSPNV